MFQLCLQICKIKGHDIYTYTADIPGADLDPALKPIIFPYIDLNLQVPLMSFLLIVCTAVQNCEDASPLQCLLVFLQTLGLPAPAARSMPTAVPAAVAVPAPSRLASAGPSHAPVLGQQSSQPGQAPPHVLGVNTNALNTTVAATARGTTTPVQKPSVAVSGRDAPAVDTMHRALAPSGPQYSQQAADETAARAMLGAIFKRIADPAADRQQVRFDQPMLAAV
jgi:hypothetical protein